ncbi:unnamed protein product [Miscanthus lutarioriparius]|uniref:HAT C-terminal dimerisation domain-containing protein n=1 Tax=Miscanthus lutarioriparius TaxID=422564 RepID=A0A811MHW3_9POAL|nr:unnamed protein product [Miscanthus lutarioriparius]
MAHAGAVGQPQPTSPQVPGQADAADSCRMEKKFAKKDASTHTASTQESRVVQKRPRIELDMNDIVADPGLRKPIDEFHHDIRDDARRAYLQMSPYQPNCEYERTAVLLAREKINFSKNTMILLFKELDSGEITLGEGKTKKLVLLGTVIYDGVHITKKLVRLMLMWELVLEVLENISDDERSTQLLRCVACLDPTNEFANFEIEKLVELAKIYYADFSDYECEKLRTELENFMDEVKHDEEFCSCIDLGGLAEKMVKTDRHTYFPLVYRLIELVLILPVATATVERAFSAMNIIKTDRRNKMNDDWMNNSMICYIERDLFASIEDDKILKRFQGLRNRKINLPPKVPSTRALYSLAIHFAGAVCGHGRGVLKDEHEREEMGRGRREEFGPNILINASNG